MFRIKPVRESLRVLTWNEKGEVVGLTEEGRKASSSWDPMPSQDWRSS